MSSRIPAATLRSAATDNRLVEDLAVAFAVSIRSDFTVATVAGCPARAARSPAATLSDWTRDCTTDPPLLTARMLVGAVWPTPEGACARRLAMVAGWTKMLGDPDP